MMQSPQNWWRDSSMTWTLLLFVAFSVGWAAALVSAIFATVVVIFLTEAA